MSNHSRIQRIMYVGMYYLFFFLQIKYFLNCIYIYTYNIYDVVGMYNNF